MPNLAAVIKAEIQRLTQKGIRQALGGLKSDNVRLRKDQTALRKELIALKKALAKGVPTTGSSKTARPADSADSADSVMAGEGKRGPRPTGKTVRALREKFGMSQDEFSRLTGVGRVTIARWEAVDGRVQFRGKGTRESFGAIMKLGKKEAWTRIGGKPVTAEQTKPAAKEVKTGVKRGRKSKLPQVVVLPVDAAPAATPKAAQKTKPGKVGKVTRKRS